MQRKKSKNYIICTMDYFVSNDLRLGGLSYDDLAFFE